MLYVHVNVYYVIHINVCTMYTWYIVLHVSNQLWYAADGILVSE